jgi:hypothetical protein
LNIYASPSAPIRTETLAPFIQPAPSSSAACCDSTEPHDHSSHSHPPPAFSSPHANDISSVTIPLPVVEDVRGGAFHEIISTLIWEGKLPPPLPSATSTTTATTVEEPLDLLRSKGFLRTTDGRSWILQGVREIYDIAEVPQAVIEKEREEGKREVEPKLVLIGRGLGDGGEVRRRIEEGLKRGIEEEKERRTQEPITQQKVESSEEEESGSEEETDEEE